MILLCRVDTPAFRGEIVKEWWVHILTFLYPYEVESRQSLQAIIGLSRLVVSLGSVLWLTLVHIP